MDPLYENALNLAEKLPASPSAISKVAKATSEEAARWAFSQWSLRARAAQKFERAAEMLFDRDGLEMATHEAVAAYHASLFPQGELVLDLTVGIGADLIALAKRGPAVGFEIDPARAALAEHNLKVEGVEAKIIIANALAGYEDPLHTPRFTPDTPTQRPTPNPEDPLHTPRFTPDAPTERPTPHAPRQSPNTEHQTPNTEHPLDAPRPTPHAPQRPVSFLADPARRSSGRRSIDPDDFQPNPREVVEAFPDAMLGIIKLTPMASDEFLDSFGGHVRFLSFGGECREALVLVGQEAKGGRMAVHLESGEQLPEGGEIPETPEPLTYLYEADPAAIRAHALATLCDRFDLVLLADSGGYLTGEEPIQSPWLKGFRVVGSGRFDLSSLKKMLRDLDSATPVLKQRLANQDLQKLRKQLILKGKKELAVALYPYGKSIRQAILEPLR